MKETCLWRNSTVCSEVWGEILLEEMVGVPANAYQTVNSFYF